MTDSSDLIFDWNAAAAAFDWSAARVDLTDETLPGARGAPEDVA